MCGTLVHALVLRAETVKSNTGKGSKNQKIPRNSRWRLQKRSLDPSGVYTHTESVHADIGGHDLAQTTQKVVSEQGDGGMRDGR